MERYRVIFLDIDGVLNSVQYYGKVYYRNLRMMGRLVCDFDPKAVKRLNYICAVTGAHVVLSSTWRLGKSLDDLRRLFKRVGLDCLLVGKTERFHSGDFIVPRGCEIKDFYNKHYDYPSYYERVGSKLKGYLILDDDSDMLYEQRDHFLKTDGRYGLTDDDVPKAIEILMKPLPIREEVKYYE